MMKFADPNDAFADPAERRPAVIDFTETGLPGLGLEPGDHVCALYFGPVERDQIMRSYLQEGLRAGDKCLCLVDGVDPADVVADIGHHGDGESTQLVVQRSADVYLRSGEFSAEQMIEFLDKAMSAATNGGYSFVRAAGEMTWVLAGPPGVEQLFDYESDINRFAPRYPQMLMCMYDLESFGGNILLDLIKTHPKILLGGMVLDNPHYLSPDEFRATRR
jgi:hypothetical protein